MMGMLWLKLRTRGDWVSLSKGAMSGQTRQETAVGEEKNGVFWDGINGLCGLCSMGQTEEGLEGLFSSFGSSG